MPRHPKKGSEALWSVPRLTLGGCVTESVTPTPVRAIKWRQPWLPSSRCRERPFPGRCGGALPLTVVVWQHVARFPMMFSSPVPNPLGTGCCLARVFHRGNYTCPRFSRDTMPEHSCVAPAECGGAITADRKALVERDPERSGQLAALGSAWVLVSGALSYPGVTHKRALPPGR